MGFDLNELNNARSRFEINDAEWKEYNKVTQMYIPELEKYGKSIPNESHKETQENLFNLLKDNIDITNKNIIDFGCNVGVLSSFLKNKLHAKKVTGIEQNRNALYFAKKFYPEVTFIESDGYDFIRNCYNLYNYDTIITTNTFDLKYTLQGISYLYETINDKYHGDMKLIVAPAVTYRNNNGYLSPYDKNSIKECLDTIVEKIPLTKIINERLLEIYIPKN